MPKSFTDTLRMLRSGQFADEFWYELIRPDLVYQTAAMGLIEQVRAGIGAVPLRMGAAE